MSTVVHQYKFKVIVQLIAAQHSIDININYIGRERNIIATPIHILNIKSNV